MAVTYKDLERVAMAWWPLPNSADAISHNMARGAVCGVATIAPARSATHEDAQWLGRVLGTRQYLMPWWRLEAAFPRPVVRP